MASAAKRLGVQLVRHSFRTRPSSTAPFRPVGPTALFHCSPYRRDGDKSGGAAGGDLNTKTQAGSAGSGVTPDSDERSPEIEENVKDDGVEKEGFLQFPVGTSAEAKEEAIRKWDELLADPPAEGAREIREFKAKMQEMEQEIEGEVPMGADDELEIPDDFLEMKPEYGIFAEGEEYPEEEGEDDKFEGDDITSLAHGELERHREIREYMRLAAYELPLLSKYAKEFVPPGKDRPLRFRHTTYLGEKHPARHKIVLEFCTADLPLEPAQRLKLVKLVGQRYDPQTDTVKMSCEMYENAAQNKRYLGDLVGSLIKEARNQSDAEGGKDAFDDVPVDFRHVRWRKRHAFPDHWSLTPERQAALRQAHGERAADELRRRQQGQIASGEAAIEAAQRAEQAAAYETAHPVGARRPVPTLRR